MFDAIQNILLNEDSTYSSTYAILDASGKDDVYYKALFYEDKMQILFDEEELETVSPYLVKLNKEDEVTQWILENYQDANWMSFIQSSQPYEELLKILKAFTKMYDEEEEHYTYVRYWDPRAVEIVLDMFGEDGREIWFQTVEAMYARDTLEKNQMLKFTKVGKVVISLSQEVV